MKNILLTLLFTTTLFGVSIDESLLKVHSILIPKIFLMDYKYKDKIKDNTIKITILYARENYKSATSLKNKIEHKYTSGINSHKIQIELSLYEDLDEQSSNIYYLLPTTQKNISKVLKYAFKDKALTFSYLLDDLKNGVMVSINIGSNIKPAVNLSATKSSNIIFRPLLLKVSTIYIDGLEMLNMYNLKDLDYIVQKNATKEKVIY